MRCQGALVTLAALSFDARFLVEGHGYLKASSIFLQFCYPFHSVYLCHNHLHLTYRALATLTKTPRSRNFYAYDIIGKGECVGPASCPPGEYCPHCLNANDGICGKSPSNNYETISWLDRNGDPMPWTSQVRKDQYDNAIHYEEGGTITIDSYLDTHHNGHMEIRACVVDDSVPGSCTAPEEFAGNELQYVSDNACCGDHPPMPADPNHPERGMYAGGQAGGLKEFSFEYRLPVGIRGEKVLLQWKYITANSCSPPGYDAYFALHSNLPDSYWTHDLPECTPPYPNDGSRSDLWPEQFFNCAEITILERKRLHTPTISPKPTLSPTTAEPTVSEFPTKSPIIGSCLAKWADCTNGWADCCEGTMCRQIDEMGYGRCLADSCQG